MLGQVSATLTRGPARASVAQEHRTPPPPPPPHTRFVLMPSSAHAHARVASAAADAAAAARAYQSKRCGLRVMRVMPTLRPMKGVVAPVGRGALESFCVVLTGDTSRGASLPGERGGGDVAPTRRPPVGWAPGVGVVRPERAAAVRPPPPELVEEEEWADEWPSGSLLGTRRTPDPTTEDVTPPPPTGRTGGPETLRIGLGEAAPERELGRTPAPPDDPPPGRVCPTDDDGVESCMFRSLSTKELPRALVGRSLRSPDALLKPERDGMRTRLNMLPRPAPCEPRWLICTPEEADLGAAGFAEGPHKGAVLDRTEYRPKSIWLIKTFGVLKRHT